MIRQQPKTTQQQKRDAAKRRRAASRAKVITGQKKAPTKATAMDAAKYAPGRGGLGALARKVKAAKKADAHVQAYRRHKKKP